MTQLSHQEARKLLQFRIDQNLDPKEERLLGAHLNTCTDCNNYASELDELGKLLHQAMKSKWSRLPTPLSTEQIISLSKNKAFAFASGLLTTRTAIIVLMIFAILITTWRFSTNLTSDPVPSVVIPVPTPSTQLTSTIVMTQECAYVTYHVQEDDSWASIASQFSVSQEMLMDFNGMEDETVLPSMQIRIPVCDRTPTATDDTPTTTITITPQFESITLTPG